MKMAALMRRFDSLGGPDLFAFELDDLPPNSETGWHSHARGQFIHVEKGLICVRTERGVWALLPHRVGWMPPGWRHTVRIIERVRGWGVALAPQAVAGMPAVPSVLHSNDLMRALVHRAAGWATCDALDAEQRRVMDVLMDEVRHASVPNEPLHLPMPGDRRLLRMTQALLAHPDDTRSLAEWAQWAGLSARTASRLFRSETGHSFAQWRQQARLAHALQHLSQGETVAGVADALGYDSVSAFIAMFRRSYGQSPGRYLRLHAAT